jgi:hypothetical protein
MGNSEDFNINDFYKGIKDYCSNKKKYIWTPAKRVLNIKKQDLIIFEAPYNKIDFKLLQEDKRLKHTLVMPMDKMFIEIVGWEKENKDTILKNIGGILIFKELFEKRVVYTAYTIWLNIDKNSERVYLKPISLTFFDDINISTKEEPMEKYYIGSYWKNYNTAQEIDEEIKKELSEKIKEILLNILIKIEKKEYTSYKKWTHLGILTREIVYSHDVSQHKRHFWKDSGRFKIPLLTKEQWEKEGYGTDEVVYRNRELRRDVPYRTIGNFLVGEKEIKKVENKRIKLFCNRILKQEEKIYSILKDIYPGKIIRRHDRKTLKSLELDFNLPELRLGIEYDGEQHYDKELYEKLYGDGFEQQVRRDRQKDQECRRKNIKLVRIKFDEPLTIKNIRKLLK